MFTMHVQFFLIVPKQPNRCLICSNTNDFQEQFQVNTVVGRVRFKNEKEEEQKKEKKL